MDKSRRGKGNARTRRRAAPVVAGGAAGTELAAASDAIEPAGKTGEIDGGQLVGTAAIADDGLAEMLGRVDAEKAASEQAAAPATLAITVENFPGLCMGASMLTSLSLHKIGFGALTTKEGEQLTAALLKNAQAWDLTAYLGNAKVAAAIDLVGVGVAILMPRIIADAQRQAKSPTQAAAADAITAAA